MQKLFLASVTATLMSLPMAAMAETRCGWLENPTPANWWLIDKDDTWIISAQGGFQSDGMDLIGDISAGDYVTTNGNYGYACACMDVMTDAQNSRITMIHSFRQLKMSKCTNDNSLPAAPDQ